MAIMIGENYKLEADRLNIILLSKTQPRDVKDEQEGIDDPDIKEKGWRIDGYFSTLSNVLKRLVDLEVKNTSLADLKTIVTKVDEAERLIEKVCPIITVSDMMKERKRKSKCDAEEVEKEVEV